MSSQTIEEMLEGYFLATTKAISVLLREDLFPHALVIIYSTIDTCGLLDAPATQTEASGKSFQDWVTKYVLNDPAIEFNEVDLWGARCAVLHTFTSQSRLSNDGKARQLLYYTGDKSDPHIQSLISFTKGHENGAHLPVHYGDLADAVFAGMKAFVLDLAALCATSPPHLGRLRQIVQTYAHKPAP